MSYKPRPRADVEYDLSTDRRFRRYLDDTARYGKEEIVRADPWTIRGRRGDAVSGTRVRDGVLEGFFGIRGSLWHIDEFGSVNGPGTATIRRAATAVLSRVGGTFRDTERET